MWPGPVTVMVAVVVAPAASVPDIGVTVTFLARPGGSETDQVTVPPEAVSVIVPLAGGTTSSVAGLTVSVPAPGGVLVVEVAGADTDAEADVPGVALGGALLPPEVAPAVGMTLACAVALAPGVPAAPRVCLCPSSRRAGAAPPDAPAVGPPPGGTPW